MADHSRYQQGIIKRYYDNRDQLDEQKLSELVTNLYLAESEKKKVKLWESAEGLMERLDVPDSRIQHVMAGKDAAVLAAVVQDIQNGKIVKKKKKS
ncbi:MAG: hypothetical protein O3A00_20190 [Planctomycetota bacterium]|nr:hypothetical protein [Planctomycetota bacterium]